jgi:hypothetical protein
LDFFQRQNLAKSLRATADLTRVAMASSDGNSYAFDAPAASAASMATKPADHFELPGKIAWLASLDTSAKPAKEFRRTSIMYVRPFTDREHQPFR